MNTAQTYRVAAREQMLRYGCKTYRVAVRAKCGHLAFVRRSDRSLCLECSIKEKRKHG